MQQSKNNKVLITITLFGLGLVAGVFGPITWLVGGGSELGSQLTNNQRTQPSDRNSNLGLSVFDQQANPCNVLPLT